MVDSERPLIFGEVLYDCFPDGQAILGGAPFNVAWHLQGFGLAPLFISRVGDDALGRRVREAMHSHGMDTSGLQLDSAHPTGRVTITLSGGGHDFDITPDQAYDYIDREALPSMPETALFYHGSLASRSPVSAQTLAFLRRHYAGRCLVDVNLRGMLNCHHVVLPRMVQRESGKVVNISSDAGRVGSSMQAVYSACKGGVIAFTKTLARELARSGITLNAVCPGPTETPLLEGLLQHGDNGEKVYAALKRAIPMKRLGQPDDVPGVVAFLASDDADFITGQVISVSGGLTMVG